MSNSTLVITVTTPRGSGDLARLIKATSAPRDEARTLEQYFSRLKSGLESASFVVQTSASAPVRAFGTFTLTYASISNNDTCVIGATTLTAVTGTPATESQFKKETDLATTLANMIACVNAHSVLSLLVKATTAATGVITLTAHAAGVIGNRIGLTGSTGIVRSGTNFTTGAGGIETAPTNSYSRGL